MLSLFIKYLRLRQQSAPSKKFVEHLHHRLSVVAEESGRIPMKCATPWYARMSLFFAGPVAIALVLACSVGTYAYASPAVGEDNALYPVKTGIEKVVQVMHLSPSASAEFQAKIIERRADEAAYRIEKSEPLTPPNVRMHDMFRAAEKTEKALEKAEIDAETRTRVRANAKRALTNVKTRIEFSEMSKERKNELVNSLQTHIDVLEE
jgi:hypothetical protein